MPTINVTASTVHSEVIERGGYFTPSAVVDANGNTFEAFLSNNYWLWGNQGAGAIVLKRNRSGAIVDTAQVRSADGRKGDGVCIMPSGSDLHVYITDHSTNTDTNRTMGLCKYVWQGVFAPYAVGQLPMGAAGAYTSVSTDPGGGGGGTGGTGATADEVAAKVMEKLEAALLDANHPFTKRMRNNMRSAIKQEVSPDESGLTTINNIQPALYSFIKDRVWEVWSQNVAHFRQWHMDRIYETFHNNAPGVWSKLRAWGAGTGPGPSDSETSTKEVESGEDKDGTA